MKARAFAAVGLIVSAATVLILGAYLEGQPLKRSTIHLMTGSAP